MDFDKLPKIEPVKSIYIYGDPGSGKTILMDMFF
jgi:predicted ATPase